MKWTRRLFRPTIRPTTKWILKLVGASASVVVNAEGHRTAGFVISLEGYGASRHGDVVIAELLSQYVGHDPSDLVLPRVEFGLAKTAQITIQFLNSLGNRLKFAAVVIYLDAIDVLIIEAKTGGRFWQSKMITPWDIGLEIHCG
jgi:hypothetical protein